MLRREKQSPDLPTAETASPLWRHLLQLSFLYVVRSDGKSDLLLDLALRQSIQLLSLSPVFASRHTHFEGQDWCAAKQSPDLPTAETASPLWRHLLQLSVLYVVRSVFCFCSWSFLHDGIYN